MTGNPLARARHLLAVGRNEDALEELARALADDPQNAHAHGLRGYALIDLDRHDEALEAANRAVGASPDNPFGYEVRGWVLLRMGRGKQALESCLEALSIDPTGVDLYDLCASCNVVLKHWREGLVAAERGLEIDPKHARCTNLRALCLRQLGELDEAEDALQSALASDPENAWTFQNLGFSLLKAGRYEEAIRAFRESLRLDPSDEGSREGLATALKARYVLYRPIVAWQMLCSRLSARFGIMLILGFFLLNRVVQTVLPDGSVVGKVVLATYVSIVWMSWAGNALFDLMLLAQPGLRGILDRRERSAAIGVLACMLLAAWGACAMVMFHGPTAEMVALSAAFAAIPMAGWAQLPNARARMVGASLAGAALGLAVLAAGLDLWVTSYIGWDFSDANTTEFPKGEFEQMMVRYRGASQTATVSLLISVGSSWLLSGLGFVPEKRGGRGARHRPR